MNEPNYFWLGVLVLGGAWLVSEVLGRISKSLEELFGDDDDDWPAGGNFAH